MELKIDRSIAARYMGIKDGKPDELTEKKIEEAEKLLREDITPASTYSVFDIIGSVMMPVDEFPKVVITGEKRPDGAETSEKKEECKSEEGSLNDGENSSSQKPDKVYVDDECMELNEYMALKGTSLRLPGKSIVNLLKPCEKAVLICATLGSAVDGRLRRLQVSDVVLALAYDALASVAVDELCDDLQAEIAEKLPDYAQTMRFSPGYGDMPLSVQGEFLSCINAEKRCGVSVTEGGMLTPIKTITAVFGLEKKGNSYGNAPGSTESFHNSGEAGECVVETGNRVVSEQTETGNVAHPEKADTRNEEQMLNAADAYMANEKTSFMKKGCGTEEACSICERKDVCSMSFFAKN